MAIREKKSQRDGLETHRPEIMAALQGGITQGAIKASLDGALRESGLERKVDIMDISARIKSWIRK